MSLYVYKRLPLLATVGGHRLHASLGVQAANLLNSRNVTSIGSVAGSASARPLTGGVARAIGAHVHQHRLTSGHHDAKTTPRVRSEGVAVQPIDCLIGRTMTRRTGASPVRLSGGFMLRLVLILLASVSLSAQAQPGAKPQPSGQEKPRDLILTGPKGDPIKPRPAGVPRGYALIVGVAQYQNLTPDKQLQFPESDAEAMYRVLINNEGGSLPAENVQVPEGIAGDARQHQARARRMAAVGRAAADRVVVYFAGHGFVKDGKGYLAPWDVDPERARYAPAIRCRRSATCWPTRSRPDWKVLLTDACHSGKINAETTNEALEAQFSALPSSFLTLTATTEREQSFEDPNLVDRLRLLHLLPGAGVPRLCRQRSVRRSDHGRRTDRIRPLERAPLRARAIALADADRARRLRARDGAGRRHRVSRHVGQGAVDVRHGRHRNQPRRCGRLHRRRS